MVPFNNELKDYVKIKQLKEEIRHNNYFLSLCRRITTDNITEKWMVSTMNESLAYEYRLKKLIEKYNNLYK